MAYQCKTYYTQNIIKLTKSQYDSLKNGETVKGYTLNSKDTFVLDIDSLYNDIPTKVSQLTNDSGYLTSASLGNYEIKNEAEITLSSEGWYRVAEYNRNDKGTYGNSCELIIKRNYNAKNNEYHKIQFLSTFNNQSFKSIDKSNYQCFTKIRYAMDSVNNKSYLEVYYNENNTNGGYLKVNNGNDKYYNWSVITPVATAETVDGVTITTTYDIPANAKPVNSLDIPTKVSQLENDSGYLDKTGTISKANKLVSSQYRPASANFDHDYITNYVSQRLDISSSSMTEGKPTGDGFIATYFWDNAGTWDTQLFIPVDGNRLQLRRQKGATWQYSSWTSIPYMSDIPTKTSQLTNDSGYVVGPTSSTDNALVRFDGTTGKIIQNSIATLSDEGQLKLINWKDGRYASNVARTTWNNTVEEIIIYTKIKFLSGSVMPIIRLYGYAYGLHAPIELKICFYIYDNTYTNMGVVSNGAWRPEVRLFKYTGSDSVDYVAIGLIGNCYYGGFQVDVQAAAMGVLDSNILTTGWSVSIFTTNGNIPAIGTDKSVNVPYKSTLAALTINGTSYDGSTAVTLNLATSNHTHSNYIVGPASATDNAIARFDTTTGKLIQNSGVTIDDANVLSAAKLFAPIIETGTEDNNYFQTKKFRGQGDSATYYHAIDFGYTGHDQVDFYEYGAIWNFWKNKNSTATNDLSNLCLRISDTYVQNKQNTFTWPTTSGTLALTSDITNNLNNYVTLNTEQTISGKKTFSHSNFGAIILKRDGSAYASTIIFQNSNGTLGSIGMSDTADRGLKRWSADIGSVYTIWDSGNDGSGSGLDADLLDGKHASDFALSTSIGNGTLTIQRNGATVATFTANQVGNTTANIVDKDTLNTAGSTNDEAKLYLVGAKSQAASAQTFSDTQVYTEAGELNATSVCISEHAQIKYDSTNQCIRFVIV